VYHLACGPEMVILFLSTDGNRKNYTVGHKNGATFIFTITLANVDRFQ